MAHIISASRRTDIPRYYARWFAERRRAGFAEYRNVYGGRGRASLKPADVLGYLFWTRYARPFRDVLRSLRHEGMPCVFQYTITGYGRPLERHVPPPGRIIDDFLAVSADLPSPACIQWRYDPIVVSDSLTAAWHRENFRRLARALAGATLVVNTSLVEPYVRTIRRIADESVEYRNVDPLRHKMVARRAAPVRQAGAAAGLLLRDLSAIACDNGMQLRACCNPESELPASQCCGVQLFEPYGSMVGAAAGTLAAGPSRAACRCVRTCDIGMDDTCVAGCAYCYAVSSQPAAIANMRRHDPASSSLR